MTQKNKGRILVISTALLWGLAGVCVKSISWSTMSIVAARSLISFLLILSVNGSLKIKLSKTDFFGGLMAALTGILYVAAIKNTTAGTAIVIQYIAPILVFLYEVIFHGKKAKKWEIIFTLLVFLGVVLAFADSIDMSHIIGNILALLSAFTFAAEIIILNGEESDSENCMVIGNAIAFIICVPFIFKDPNLSFDAHNVIWVLILGIFQYGLGNLCFAKGCKFIDDIECSLLLTLEPIFNPIPVAIICGERMGVLAIIGAAVVIVSVTLYGIWPQLMEKKAV